MIEFIAVPFELGIGEYMVVRAFKSQRSPVPKLLKIFKESFDDLRLLGQYETSLKFVAFRSSSPLDMSWRGEALHQLALLNWRYGNNGLARSYFKLSMNAFKKHEALGICRVKRDYALFLSETNRVVDAEVFITHVLKLHDEDIKNAKGLRQRAISESYLCRIRLQAEPDDTIAATRLAELALDSSNWSVRDQQECIDAALDLCGGIYSEELLLRRLAVRAKRHQPIPVIFTALRIGIHLQFRALNRVATLLVRKE